MARKEPYGIEKDMKVLEGNSSRHSARLEGQFLGLIPSTGLEISTEEGKVERKGMIVKGIKDPHLRIDLEVPDVKTDKGAMEELLHLIGLDPKEADFDVLQVMEKVLRAFAKARFRNLAEVTFDGKKIYEHPEMDFDLRKVLKNIKELGEDFSRAEEAEAVILEHDEDDTKAIIKVDKVHTKFGHDIDIRIEGEISGEMLRRIINYLEENLAIEELLGVN
jgi:phosphotransferase system HPr-like phosphotransfer protein